MRVEEIGEYRERETEENQEESEESEEEEEEEEEEPIINADKSIKSDEYVICLTNPRTFYFVIADISQYA